MYFNNAEWLLSFFYPSLTWSRKETDKIIYLTFDDGPIPELTDFVLEQLKAFNARATFFCVGENIYKHPLIYKRVLQEGHRTANHTYNHLNGWKNNDHDYLNNIFKCDEVMQEVSRELGIVSSLDKKLFRPPYGKIKKSQIREVIKEFEVIMWSVLTGDFDQNLSKEDCFRKAVKYTKPGSIVVFHDNLKAERNLKYCLPRYLEYFSLKGYEFRSL